MREIWNRWSIIEAVPIIPYYPNSRWLSTLGSRNMSSSGLVRAQGRDRSVISDLSGARHSHACSSLVSFGSSTALTASACLLIHSAFLLAQIAPRPSLQWGFRARVWEYPFLDALIFVIKALSTADYCRRVPRPFPFLFGSPLQRSLTSSQFTLTADARSKSLARMGH